MSKSRIAVLIVAVSVTAGVSMAGAATLKAKYLFDHTLNAEQAGAPFLQEVAPQVEGQYIQANVFGSTRTVYHFGGDISPELQGGLMVSTNGLISGGQYSLNMVIAFDGLDNAWRRIADTLDRQSDNGFYYAPDNTLDIYPLAHGTTVVDGKQFHTVGLTVDPITSTAKGYVDGHLEFTVDSTPVELQQPNQIISFFLDNNAGSAQTEYSPGSVALISLYEGVLTDSEMGDIGSNPFGNVPEPSGVIGMLGLTALGSRRRAR